MPVRSVQPWNTTCYQTHTVKTLYHKLAELNLTGYLASHPADRFSCATIGTTVVHGKRGSDLGQFNIYKLPGGRRTAQDKRTQRSRWRDILVPFPFSSNSLTSSSCTYMAKPLGDESLFDTTRSKRPFGIMNYNSTVTPAKTNAFTAHTQHV